MRLPLLVAATLNPAELDQANGIIWTVVPIAVATVLFCAPQKAC